MTLVPRFPNAPQNYSFQNEAQFRSMVRQMLQDSTSPGIGGQSFSLIDNYPGVVGDTLVHNGSDYGATKNFTALMHFEAGVSFWDTVDKLAAQGKLFLEDSLSITGSGSLNSGEAQVSGGGTNYGYTDMSELSIGSGIPTGWSFVGDADTPTVSVANDVTEGNYIQFVPDEFEFNMLTLDAWDALVGSSGSAEMLARVYLGSHVSNRRVGGPAMRAGGTDETDMDGVVGDIYMRNAGDYESEAQDVTNSSGGIFAAGDIQEAEATATWYWIRLRVEFEGTGVGTDDYYIKAWTGDISAEPAGWDGTSIDTLTGGRLGNKMGWMMPNFPDAGSAQRLAFLSFTDDWTETAAPEAATPAPSGIKDLTYRNVHADATDSWLNVKAPAGTLGSTDAEAGFRLLRETDSDNQEGLELFNEEVSAAISMGLRMTKTGTGSYGTFTFRWDDDISLTILSPDNGGPLWTFADPIVMESTLTTQGAVGLNTAVSGLALVNVAGAFTSDGSGTSVQGLFVRPALVAVTGDTALQAHFRVGSGTIATQGLTEAISVVAAAHFSEPLITVNTGDTITHAATVYIQDAPTEGANNWALRVAAGAVGFAGTLTATGGGALTGTWTDLGIVTTVDLNGGTIDGTIIGGAVTAAGSFTLLTADALVLTNETITASTDTLDTTDGVIFLDATSNDITITLPTAAAGDGLVYWIKRIDTSANVVTVDGNGAETIDNNATVTLNTMDSITITSDGTEWWII
jgi:hypothetical protein